MRLFKHLPKRVSVVFAALALSFAVGVGQSTYADPYPIGNPFFNYASKTCMRAPDIVITIHEMSMSGEPIFRQVRIRRNICQYYDANNELLGWSYEIIGGNWY